MKNWATTTRKHSSPNSRWWSRCPARIHQANSAGVYEAQNRGGKGIKGATSDEEDPIAHLFVSSTHDFLLFFTDKGKVHWIKVYDLPLQARTGKGRLLRT